MRIHIKEPTMTQLENTIISGSLMEYAKLIKLEAKKMKVAGNPMYIDLYDKAEAILYLGEKVDSMSR